MPRPCYTLRLNQGVPLCLSVGTSHLRTGNPSPNKLERFVMLHNILCMRALPARVGFFGTGMSCPAVVRSFRELAVKRRASRPFPRAKPHLPMMSPAGRLGDQFARRYLPRSVMHVPFEVARQPSRLRLVQLERTPIVAAGGGSTSVLGKANRTLIQHPHTGHTEDLRLGARNDNPSTGQHPAVRKRPVRTEGLPRTVTLDPHSYLS